MRGCRVELAQELPGFARKTPEEIRSGCPIPIWRALHMGWHKIYPLHKFGSFQPQD